jgi:hypothetical protein
MRYFVRLNRLQDRIWRRYNGRGRCRHRKCSRKGGAPCGYYCGLRKEMPPCRNDWHSHGILRINLSHDLPHSLGQACRGVGSTTAGRLFFKLEKRITAK